MTPLLSILIPTYNRADCLDLNLKCLANQLQDLNSNKIEIIVSDNCSEDHTQSIFQKYVNRDGFHFLSGEKNIGSDLNFLKLFQRSRGQFVWIFGDDEVLYANSLRTIINTLQKNPEAGLIHMTQFGHLKLSDFDSHKIYELPEIEIYDDSNEFLQKVSYNLSFITSNIFNRKYLKPEIISLDKFIGTSLYQYNFYLQCALGAKGNIFINGRIFSQLLNNSGGYKLFEVFGPNQQKVFSFFKTIGLKNKTIDKINNDLLKSFFPTFLLFISSSRSAETEDAVMFVLLKSFWKYLNFWIYCFPILLIIPAKLRPFIFNVIKQIKKKLK